jgi:pentose-5-phosphate-3-epimerase
MRARLEALVGAVSVPTIAEGGINKNNYKAFKEVGINILVIGTAFDNIAAKAIQSEVREFIK